MAKVLARVLVEKLGSVAEEGILTEEQGGLELEEGVGISS